MGLSALQTRSIILSGSGPVFTEDSRWPASEHIWLFGGQQASQKSQLCSLDEGYSLPRCKDKSLPRWLSGKESPAGVGDEGNVSSIPGSGKILWRRKWQPTPVFLPEKFHGQRSQAGYSPWAHKELDRTKWFRVHIHPEQPRMLRRAVKDFRCYCLFFVCFFFKTSLLRCNL